MKHSNKLMYETPHLIIRQWRDSDIEPFIALNQDPEVMEYFPHTYTREETIERYESFKDRFDKHGFTFYACELKDTCQFIGFVGLIYQDSEDLPFTPCIEIGWRLAKAYWNQGLATEAARKCLEIGFIEFDFEEILSFTAKINVRSQRIMQKLGMASNPKEDFYYSKLPKEHALCPHVLYRIRKCDWVRLHSTD